MQHGVRLYVPDEYEDANVGLSCGEPPILRLTVLQTDLMTSNDRKPGSWIKRKILRRSSAQTSTPQLTKHARSRRSISDFSVRLKKKSGLQDKDLQDLVRLCGVSLLYLPSDFAVGSLSLPTCFRATAQYLVQHGSCYFVFLGAFADMRKRILKTVCFEYQALIAR